MSSRVLRSRKRQQQPEAEDKPEVDDVAAPPKKLPPKKTLKTSSQQDDDAPAKPPGKKRGRKAKVTLVEDKVETPEVKPSCKPKATKSKPKKTGNEENNSNNNIDEEVVAKKSRKASRKIVAKKPLQSDGEDQTGTASTSGKRVRKPRAAASKVSYKVDSDEECEPKKRKTDSENDDSKPIKRKTKAAARTKAVTKDKTKTADKKASSSNAAANNKAAASSSNAAANNKAAASSSNAAASSSNAAAAGDAPVMKKVEYTGKIPVDGESESLAKGDYEVVIVGNEVFNVMLNQTNIGGNNNKFYIIQMLKHRRSGWYSVWFRWGRVGKKGQNSLIEDLPFASARTVFEKKFRDKTLNDWAHRDNFESQEGKYEMIHMDYGDEKDLSANDKDNLKKKTPKSKLNVKVQSLMKLIFDLKEFDSTVKEMKFDPKRSPLGKLTTKQIQSGFEILTSIEKILEKGGNNRKRLIEACSKFYTRVPHDFGMRRPPLIETKEEIKEKIELLEALGDIKIAMKLMEDSQLSSQLNPLDSQYQSLDCGIDVLNRKSRDFALIEKYVNNTHASTHNQYKLNIANVFTIRKPSASAASNLTNRQLLWHGSRLSNYCGILKEGLRIAPPQAPTTGYMFGKGIYFADMVSKSANYCYSSARQPSGLLLLCEVALGEWQELKHADYNASSLPHHINSTKGIGKTQPDPKQNVFTDDGVLVPLGRPTSTPNSHDSALLYNEYIVYNTDQVTPRYLVQVDFAFNSLW